MKQPQRNDVMINEADNLKEWCNDHRGRAEVIYYIIPEGHLTVEVMLCVVNLHYDVCT